MKKKTSLRLGLLFLGCLLFAGISWAAPVQLLSNPGFEIQKEGEVAPGWQLFGIGALGQQQDFVKGDAYEGDWAFVIRDDSPTLGYGLRSEFFPAEPGQTYRAGVVGKTDGDKAMLYLDFSNENKTRVGHKTVGIGDSDWEEVEVTLEAPPGTKWVSIILYVSTNQMATAYFDNASLELMRSDVWLGGSMETTAGEGSLDYSPENGAVVTTNPPSFVWIPVGSSPSYTLEYSTDPNFAPAQTTRVENLDISIYTPSAIFADDQTWYWRVHAVDHGGRKSPYTDTRAFNIAADAVNLVLPPLDEVRAALPQSHPKLFVTPDTLAEWRAKSTGDMLSRLIWGNIHTSALTASFTVLPDEPPNCRPGGVWDVDLWREYSITTRATNNMENLAFAYMITGDEEIGKAARKWMLHIASWDPKGATSAAINDESSMPILYQMSRAYTWAYDALSPADRQIILDVMRVRGNEAYRILKNRKFENNPYASHAGRSLGFLGEAGMAFMGEIPEAQEWFDYVVRIFYAIYPAWGKDPGGWAEGHAYWTSYMNRVFWFVDAFQAATGLDLYAKAFFQNTGDFKLYTQPPYSKMGPFGDFADRGPVTSDGAVMGHLAAVYNNSYYKWYAHKLGSMAEMGVMGYIRHMLHDGISVKAQDPDELPPSAYFSDIGWTVFHRQLGDANNGIQFMFKSSPYGSYSHSFADQNTFTLEAYGEPLAISSGYRPWYGSDHHMRWTKTTQAHNGLLIDGRGQRTQSLAAKGEILGFLNGKSFDYTAGDAQKAYGGTMERYVRHAVYLRPDLFVLFDDVKASRASKYSWLLHAYQEMSIDEQTGHIHLAAGKADLDTYLWASEAISYEQTDEFAVPLDEPMNKPVQWHLTATTQKASPEAFFLAVLAPSKAGVNRDLKVTPISSGSAEGVLLEDETGRSLVLFHQEAAGELVAAGLTARGVVAAWTQEEGKEALLLVEGDSWRSSALGVEASVPVSMELTVDKDGATGVVEHPAVPGSESYDLSLRLGRQVASVSSTHEIVSWQADQDVLHLHLVPGEHQLTVTFK